MSIVSSRQNQAIAKAVVKAIADSGGLIQHAKTAHKLYKGAKKAYGRYKGRQPKRSRVPRGVNNLRLGSKRNGKAFLPRTALINHKFSIFKTIDGTDADTQYFNIRLNDMNDPAHNSSTVQPFGSDQMKALYSKYVVVGATWKVTFYSQTNSGSQISANQTIYSLIGRTDALGEQEELPATPDIFYMEGWRGGGCLRHAYSGKPTTIRGKWSAKKQFKEYVDDDDLIRDTKIGALADVTPTTLANMTIGSFCENNANPGSIGVRINVVYHCLWHDPKTIGLS